MNSISLTPFVQVVQPFDEDGHLETESHEQHTDKDQTTQSDEKDPIDRLKIIHHVGIKHFLPIQEKMYALGRVNKTTSQVMRAENEALRIAMRLKQVALDNPLFKSLPEDKFTVHLAEIQKLPSHAQDTALIAIIQIFRGTPLNQWQAVLKSVEALPEEYRSKPLLAMAEHCKHLPIKDLIQAFLQVISAGKRLPDKSATQLLTWLLQRLDFFPRGDQGYADEPFDALLNAAMELPEKARLQLLPALACSLNKLNQLSRPQRLFVLLNLSLTLNEPVRSSLLGALVKRQPFLGLPHAVCDEPFFALLKSASQAPDGEREDLLKALASLFGMIPLRSEFEGVCALCEAAKGLPELHAKIIDRLIHGRSGVTYKREVCLDAVEKFVREKCLDNEQADFLSKIKLARAQHTEQPWVTNTQLVDGFGSGLRKASAFNANEALRKVSGLPIPKPKS